MSMTRIEIEKELRGILLRIHDSMEELDSLLNYRSSETAEIAFDILGNTPWSGEGTTCAEIATWANAKYSVCDIDINVHDAYEYVTNMDMDWDDKAECIRILVNKLTEEYLK